MMPRHSRVAMVRPMNRRIGCFAFSFGSFGSFGAFPGFPGSLTGCSRRLWLTFTLRPAADCEELPSPPRWIFLISLLEIGIAS